MIVFGFWDKLGMIHENKTRGSAPARKVKQRPCSLQLTKLSQNAVQLV